MRRPTGLPTHPVFGHFIAVKRSAGPLQRFAMASVSGTRSELVEGCPQFSFFDAADELTHLCAIRAEKHDVWRGREPEPRLGVARAGFTHMEVQEVDPACELLREPMHDGHDLSAPGSTRVKELHELRTTGPADPCGITGRVFVRSCGCLTARDARHQERRCAEQSPSRHRHRNNSLSIAIKRGSIVGHTAAAPSAEVATAIMVRVERLGLFPVRRVSANTHRQAAPTKTVAR